METYHSTYPLKFPPFRERSMRNKIIVGASAAALVAAFGYAAFFGNEDTAPKAVITGPETAQVNQAVRLDTSSTHGEQHLILVPETPYLNCQGQLLLFPEKPGDYTAVVVAAGSMDGTIVFDDAMHTVRVSGGGPAPNPNPPNPNPDPQPEPPQPQPTPSRYGLDQFVLGSVGSVPLTKDQRDRDAIELAASFEAVVAAIAAGVLRPGPMSEDDPYGLRPATDLTRDGNVHALGGRLDAWKPFLTNLSNKLQNINDIRSLSDLAIAWTEIANGLRLSVRSQGR